LVEPAARFENIRIPLIDPVHGLTDVSGVIGIPRWWPTGSRVGVVLAHDAGSAIDDPMLEALHQLLTEQRYLTLRFNFPFAEAKKKKVDDAPVLRRALQSAVNVLARDPTAAPAHLFVGGAGLGGQVAADVATARTHVDGLFILGYPLHPQGRPEKARADHLYRVTAPLLFVQGTRDRRCDLDALRRTLKGVGAPRTLHICDDADHHFQVTKRGERQQIDVYHELLVTLDSWIQKILGA
jgi:hypothetical protein